MKQVLRLRNLVWTTDDGESFRSSDGHNLYDALAGSALCGKVNSVLLIASDANRVCVTDFIASHRGDIEKRLCVWWASSGFLILFGAILMRSYYLLFIWEGRPTRSPLPRLSASLSFPLFSLEGM